MRSLTLILFLVLSFSKLYSQSYDERGVYFSKKDYQGGDIPLFSESRDKLPIPVLEENKEWLDMYWKCWEIAFKHFKKPPEGSPFVSNILDEAFTSNIFQWDMIFMVMFARYADHIFPAVNSLDNFYCRQHISGFICREIEEQSGEDFIFLGERKHTINPPLFSWAEVESFKNTGDMSRFEMVLPVLEKYVDWLNQEGDHFLAEDKQAWQRYGRKAANSVHQLYWNTGFGSGMDNTPRSGDGWVDMSSQMVIQYNNLAEICEVLGKQERANIFRQRAKEIGDRINDFCWDEEDGLYYDVDSEGRKVKWKTSACFWPMLAGIASSAQCDRLVEHLSDTASFWRYMVFPTLAADQEHYSPKGDYWRGGVWAPTNYMIVKGLELNGYEDLASRASINYLNGMHCVSEKTKTVWENYSPDSCDRGYPAKPDFVGWTGIGPISLLIENVLGIRVSALDSSVSWRITRLDHHGISNLRVGSSTVSLVCKKRESVQSPIELSITSDSNFTLRLVYGDVNREIKISEGSHELSIQ